MYVHRTMTGRTAGRRSEVDVVKPMIREVIISWLTKGSSACEIVVRVIIDTSEGSDRWHDQSSMLPKVRLDDHTVNGMARIFETSLNRQGPLIRNYASTGGAEINEEDPITTSVRYYLKVSITDEHV